MDFYLCVPVFLNRTDIGSITILWSQPVGGLQILAPDGRWKWVRHIDNGLVREW
jgi:isopenicillin N synthase-like dioxygenase